jgi:predicted permease
MIRDLRLAVRLLFKNPTFALSAVITLAIGIGVNSTIFTIASAVLFRPMPGVADPARLMWLSGLSFERPRPGGISYPEYIDYRDRTREVFSEFCAFAPASFSVASSGDPQRVRGHFVTGSYFATIGAVPAVGRLLAAADDRPAADVAVVLSHRLWRERFGSAANILDRPLVVNGRRVAIAGVAQEGFIGPELGQAADLWAPIAAHPLLNARESTWLDERGTYWLRAMGRLRPGVTTREAQTRVAGIAASLEQANPETNQRRTAIVTSMTSGLSPGERGEILPVTVLLLSITALVLLISCANVANLLLARGAGRSLEIAIRAALGASRARLVGQLLAESLLLAAAASAAGLLFAFWGADLLLSLLSESDFRGLDAGVDSRVLAFTAALAAASVCVFGLVPAFSATRSAALPGLRETAHGGGGRSRLQGLFVVTQLSLSLVLLIAAGLGLRALQRTASIDLGFNPHELMTAAYDLTLQNYTPERRERFRHDLLEGLRTTPGVRSATIVNVPPLSGIMMGTVAGASGTHGEVRETQVFMNAVGPDYFGTLEIPMLRGRPIVASDDRTSPGVVVVNETLARRLWPDDEAVGRTLTYEGRTVEVVGVSGDSKYDEPAERARAFMYIALAQRTALDRETVMVRTSALMPDDVQAQIRALDPDLPVFDVRPFDAVLRDRSDKQRGVSILVGAFGALALLLAATGLYGVMAYAVTRRTRELGVRLALGAAPAQITALIARDGLRLALTGVVVGCLLGLPLAQAIGTLVFGVQIGDVLAFAGASTILVGVALTASLLPARRAARLDPVTALRVE